MEDNVIEKEEKQGKKDGKSFENLATDILSMQIGNNKRMFGISMMCIVAIIVIAIGTYVHNSYITNAFLNYLEQYDFSGTIEQTGVYTFSDSEGNVISSDISPEEMERILEVINGNDTSNKEKN